jgi:hypothetical protein
MHDADHVLGEHSLISIAGRNRVPIVPAASPYTSALKEHAMAWHAGDAIMFSAGRLIKHAAKECNAAFVITSLAKQSATSANPSTADRLEGQALGHVWESMPHCRLLLQREGSITARPEPRRISVLSTTLSLPSGPCGNSALLGIAAAGVMAWSAMSSILLPKQDTHAIAKCSRQL